MSDTPITLVEFCAGYGGLGLGIKRVLGERLRLIGLCELEGFAQANLISKMEAGLLARVPIWPDLRTFPYRKFRGLVDIAAAGIPCQPHSLAGKRAGGSDERFLFDAWLDGLTQMQPRLIFIENVEGLLSSRMPDDTLCIAWTIERLEAMGYRVEAGIFSAAEVGAPHQRKRVFILAYHQRERIEELAGRLAGTTQHPTAWNGRIAGRNLWPSRPGEPQHEWEPPRTIPAGESLLRRLGWMADADSIEGRPYAGGRHRDAEAGSAGEVMGHPALGQDNGRGPGDMGQAASAGQRGDDATDCAGESVGDATGSRRPRSEDAGADRGDACAGLWRKEPERASADRQTQPPLGRDPDESPGRMDYAELCVTCDNRTDELRLLGNGVVPATAAVAFATLMTSLQCNNEFKSK